MLSEQANLTESKSENQKTCLQCGYVGEMKIWLENNRLPKFIAYLGLAFWVIPSILFIACIWRKDKCFLFDCLYL